MNGTQWLFCDSELEEFINAAIPGDLDDNTSEEE